MLADLNVGVNAMNPNENGITMGGMCDIRSGYAEWF